MTKDIKPQLELLGALQNIDVELFKIDKEMSNLPIERETLGADYLVIKKDLDAAQSEKDSIEKEKSQTEIDLKTAQDWIRERETKLYAIKTNKEYQAALREVAQSKMSNKDREKRVLDAMARLEDLNKKIAQLNSALSDKEGEYKKIDEELKQKETVLKEKRIGVEKTRPELEAKIDKSIMQKYLNVKRRHSNPLADVTNGICRGCHMNIPPQLYNNVRKFDTIHNCPWCLRLLYVAPEPKAEQNEQVEAAPEKKE